MPKKSPSKKTKKAAKKPQPKGMWKILEFKKAQRRAAEQERSSGRNFQNQGHTFQPHERDPRFVKFAGPRRKVG